MASITEQSRVLGLIDTLSYFDPKADRQPEQFLEGLCAMLQARNAILYCPRPGPTHWELEHAAWVGDNAAVRRAGHQALITSTGSEQTSFAAYDPYAVEATQRNRALTIDQLIALDSAASAPHALVQRATGTQYEDQVRALLCDGPRLLAWCGAVRERNFSAEEVGWLQALVPALRKRLAWMRGTCGDSASALVDALLETLPEPALIMSRHGRIEYANAAGLHMLDVPHTRQAFSQARPRLAAGHDVADFSTLLLAATGLPDYRLVRYVGANLRRNKLVARAKGAWHLNPRQCCVLEGILQGHTNKEIAQRLDCAEVTVERHLTTLFKRSGARCRAGLVTCTHEL